MTLADPTPAASKSSPPSELRRLVVPTASADRDRTRRSVRSRDLAVRGDQRRRAGTRRAVRRHVVRPGGIAVALPAGLRRHQRLDRQLVRRQLPDAVRAEDRYRSAGRRTGRVARRRVGGTPAGRQSGRRDTDVRGGDRRRVRPSQVPRHRRLGVAGYTSDGLHLRPDVLRAVLRGAGRRRAGGRVVRPAPWRAGVAGRAAQ